MACSDLYCLGWVTLEAYFRSKALKKICHLPQYNKLIRDTIVMLAAPKSVINSFVACKERSEMQVISGDKRILLQCGTVVSQLYLLN